MSSFNTLLPEGERELQMEVLSRVISIQAYNRKPDPAGSLLHPLNQAKPAPFMRKRAAG